MIHPDDLASVKELTLNGKVFQAIEEDSTYLILSYGEVTFRAKPDLFWAVDCPPKQIGDVIKVESKGEQKSGTIVGIEWHHQRNEPFYLVAIDGKQSSKRYWNSDFK